jgi:hypothetical protein
VGTRERISEVIARGVAASRPQETDWDPGEFGHKKARADEARAVARNVVAWGSYCFFSADAAGPEAGAGAGAAAGAGSKSSSVFCGRLVKL